MAAVEQTQGSSRPQGSGARPAFVFVAANPLSPDRVPERTGAGGAVQGGLRGHSLRSLPAWQAGSPPWPGAGGGLLLMRQRVSCLPDGKVPEIRFTAT